MPPTIKSRAILRNIQLERWHNVYPLRWEIDYGRWQGRARDEVESEHNGEYDAWQEDPLTIGPQGGESGIQVLARALPVLRRIVRDHRRRSVFVVPHKGTNRLLVSSLLGFDACG